MKTKFLTLILLSFVLNPLNAEDRLFPPDAGMINVKNPPFNAKGDGIADDTVALQSAIRFALDRLDRYEAIPFVYLPAGTYRVSNSLESRVATNGWSMGWRAAMQLIGQSATGTVIRLIDQAPGFDDPGHPKAVVRTGSENPYNNNPNGSGNQAFRHSIINLTIDTGSGNPGAVALDYLANNRGTVEDVILRSGDGEGYCGLLMSRTYPGPALIKRVRIEGFNSGVWIWNSEYSMTFEHLTLVGQKRYGIMNAHNVLHIRGLVSSNSVPVITAWPNSSHITLLDGVFSGGSATNAALAHSGTLYLRNVTSSGYGKVVLAAGAEVLGGPDSVHLDEYLSHPAMSLFPSAPQALGLPVEETPEFHTNDFELWANVISYGATVDSDSNDDAPGIQAAIDSGKPIVYLPWGKYHVSRPIILRGAVRKFTGMVGCLKMKSTFQGDALVIFTNGSANTCILEHLCIGGLIEHSSTNTLALRHLDMKGYRNTSDGTGKVFLEDTIGRPILVNYPQRLWARQLNTEFGSAPLLENHGGTVWILGMKTEGALTAIKTVGGATELMGGLFYPLSNVSANTPLFINEEGQVCLSYVVEVQSYAVQVRETRAGITRSLLQENVPSRGSGANVALYVGAARAQSLRFEWASFPGCQQANVPWTATVRVKHADGSLASNYHGIVNLAAINTADGTSLPLAPTCLSNFVDGVWTGQLVVLATNGSVVLQAGDVENYVGYSSVFSVAPPNDVSVSLAAAPSSAILGQPLAYTITVSNSGPADATGLVVTNLLPASVDFISATPSRGSCANMDGWVICELGSLAAGQQTEIAVIVIPSVAGKLSNTVSVACNEVDPLPANNTSSVATTVILPVLRIHDTTVAEGNDGTNEAIFPVVLWPPSTNTVTVNFRTFNWSASSSELLCDFISQSGTLAFPPGVCTQTVTVPVLSDCLYESNEVFYVSLSSPANAVLGTNRAFCTILDNDPIPLVSISDSVVVEGNAGTTNAVFQVRLSQPCGLAVSVAYATANGTAREGSDYVASSGVIRFAVGSTSLVQSVVIRVSGDTLLESNESFYVCLTGIANARLEKSYSAGTILNDEPAIGLDHFQWGPIGSWQCTNTPFAVTVTAQDFFGNLLTNFAGPVYFSAVFERHGKDGILLDKEVIPAESFAGGIYTMGYSFTPTVNLRVTHLRHYAGTKVSIWSNTGALLVAQTVASAPGFWSETPLPAPVILSAGMTYRVSFYGGGQEQYFSTTSSTTNFAHGTLGFGFFAIGDAFPALPLFGPNRYMVDLVYQVEPTNAITVLPEVSGTFENGVWTGSICLAAPMAGMRLEARDAFGHVGQSDLFAVGGLQDSDQDGAPDNWELAHQLDPTDPADAGKDMDDDGHTNLQEFLAGTDPTSSASIMRLASIRQEAQSIVIYFHGLPGQRYRLEKCQNLAAGKWTTITEVTIGNNSLTAVIAEMVHEDPACFFRVCLLR